MLLMRASAARKFCGLQLNLRSATKSVVASSRSPGLLIQPPTICFVSPDECLASCLLCCCRRFEGTSHIELPCNEISGEEKDAVASQMSRLAREYFKSLVSDEHSFEKPTFYLGLDGWSVTNVLPDGAHARTPGRIELLPNGLQGFSKVGDSACFAVEVSLPTAANSL
jgi:hypothetical protein